MTRESEANFYLLDVVGNSGNTCLGTNLIHDFTAVTFSMKLTSFCEKRWFPWNPWFFV